MCALFKMEQQDCRRMDLLAQESRNANYCSSHVAIQDEVWKVMYGALFDLPDTLLKHIIQQKSKSYYQDLFLMVK